MAKGSRSYSQKTLKILFGRSGNQCAEPDCINQLIVAPTEYSAAHVLAQICHIAPASKSKGPRSANTSATASRNEADNLLLLCPNHHSIIDGQYETYPAELLLEWKRNHEQKFEALGKHSFSSIDLGALPRGAVLDDEVVRLERELRSTRYYTDGGTTERAKALGLRLLRGDLAGASSKVRADALGWCARLLALTEERSLAEEALLVAESLAQTEVVEIARAFVLLAHDKRDDAIRRIARLTSKAANSARFFISTKDIEPEHSPQWISDAGITADSLDADGKFVYLSRCVLGELWEEFDRVGATLSEDDFDAQPALLHHAALSNLIPSVPADLRRLIASQPPFDAANFPLSSDATAIERRRASRALFDRSADAAEALGSRNAPSISRYYALWIALRDPQYDQAARATLAERLRDPEGGLWSVPLAIDFQLKVDTAAVEREITRRVALHRYRDIEAALARFALIFTQPTPAVAARYLDRFRPEFVDMVDSVAIASIEVELLAKAELSEEATAKLEAAEAAGLPPEQYERLAKIIGGLPTDPDTVLAEQEFAESDSTPALVKLVASLEAQPSNPKTLHYAKLLLARTRALPDAERIAQLLATERGYLELARFLQDEADFVEASIPLRSARAWLHYSQGKVAEAAAELKIVRATRDNINDRMLAINIALTSGAWDQLAPILEEEWSDREHRTPGDLLWRANLAGLIGSPRLKDFIFYAAEQGGDDPRVLVGAYSLATEYGFERDDTVANWLKRGAELSDADGPIQQTTLADILEMKPDWDRHEEDTWLKVRAAELPLFLAGQALNRSTLDLQLRPLIRNQGIADPRRRAWVPLFSGAREVAAEMPASATFDSTSLLTLSFLGVLGEALDSFSKVVLPHTTLTWLAQERKKATYHQPSRIGAAHRLRDLMSQGKIKEFTADRSPPAGLREEVGEHLAEMLHTARGSAQDVAPRRLVVRSLPVHRVGSLGEEEADLTAYLGHMCSCKAVVEKLVSKGLLGRVEQQRARAYLQLQERERSDDPAIEDGAELLLDDLSVSYFDHLGLLGKMADAGLTVTVSKHEVAEANAFISFEQVATQVLSTINVMRETLADRIAKGGVSIAPLEQWKSEGEKEDIKSDPTFAVLAIADMVDTVVIDDRSLNRHGWIDGRVKRTQVSCSLDILAFLKKEGRINSDVWHDSVAMLRRGGALFLPFAPDELEISLSAGSSDGSVGETAELKAFRESILLARMSDCLQTSHEAPWLHRMFDGISRLIVNAWKVHNRDRAIQVSNWLLQFLDSELWVGAYGQPDASAMAPAAPALVLPPLLLMQLGSRLDGKRAENFRDWIDTQLTSPMQANQPKAFGWMVETTKMVVDNACAPGGASA